MFCDEAKIGQLQHDQVESKGLGRHHFDKKRILGADLRIWFLATAVGTMKFSACWLQENVV